MRATQVEKPMKQPSDWVNPRPEAVCRHCKSTVKAYEGHRLHGNGYVFCNITCSAEYHLQQLRQSM